MAKVTFSKLPDDEPTPFDGGGIASPRGYNPSRTSGEEAFRIATEHCRQFVAGSTVAQVFDGARVPFRQPYIYGLRERLEDCWVAYLTVSDGWEGLRSNTIILVSKTTGQVVYAGLAHDEG